MKRTYLLMAVILVLGLFHGSQAAIESWSTSAASNNSAPPDGAPEGEAPSTLNNVIRELMSQVRRFAQQTTTSSWAPDGGTANNYVVNPPIAWGSYVSGQTIRFKAANANTTGAQINVSALGNVSIVTISNTNLTSGQIGSGQTVALTYDGTYFVLTNGSTYTDPLTTRGDIPYRGASSTTRLAVGTVSQALMTDGTDPVWRSVSSLLDTITSTRGNIIYRGASSWTGLAPGTSGQFLKSNGAGADPSWAANSSVFTESWTSAPQAITSAQLYSIAHTLTATPKIIQVYLKNVVSEGQYSVGDILYLPTNSGENASGNNNIAITSTATGVNIRTGSTASVFYMLDHVSGALAALTNTSWNFMIFAAD